MTQDERQILIKTAEILYAHDMYYAGGYVEDIINDIDLINYEKTAEPITEAEKDIIADALAICDEHGYYGTGDLLLEVLNGTYTAG